MIGKKVGQPGSDWWGENKPGLVAGGQKGNGGGRGFLRTSDWPIRVQKF